MKKKIVLMSAAAGAALLFAACSSVQTAGIDKMNGMSITPSGSGVAHISGSASGYYFLWFPLFTGSTQNPGTIAVGENSANVTAVADMVTRQAKTLKASKTVDLVSMTTSMPAFPIPLLFSWKTAIVSGNAVR